LRIIGRLKKKTNLNIKEFLEYKMIKRGKLTVEVLVKLILVLISFLIIVSVVLMFVERGKVGWSDMLCAFSVRVASKTHLGFNFFPLACMPQKVGVKGSSFEVQSKIASLMRKCWWMFGESKINDIKSNLGGDDIYTCYIIDPLEIEKSIEIDPDFINFLKDSDGIEKGKEGETTFNYIQKGDSIFGICIDDKLERFEGKKVYYIKFRDDIAVIILLGLLLVLLIIYSGQIKEYMLKLIDKLFNLFGG